MWIYQESYDCDEFLELKAERDYQHEAGQRLLIAALEKEFGLQVKPEDICREPSGKPYIGRYPYIQFSISHTAGWIVCAVSRHPIGVDAEQIRHPFPKAILRKMTEGERQYIESAENPDEAFMRVWTMKEACIKMTGEGLAAFGQTECIPGQPLPGIEYKQILREGKYVVTVVEKV